MPPSITNNQSIVGLTHELPNGRQRHVRQGLFMPSDLFAIPHPIQLNHQPLIEYTSRWIECSGKNEKFVVVGTRVPSITIEKINYFGRARHQDFGRIKVFAIRYDTVDRQRIFA
jgi:hypothetical protein